MRQDEFTRKAREWDSVPERRRIADEFAVAVGKAVDFNLQSAVMDFGCGTGLVGLRFGKQVKALYMLDTSEAMLGMLRAKLADADSGNVQIISSSLRDAGLAEKSLDAIFTSMALHHVEGVQDVLNMMQSLLKDGGKLVIGELLPEDGSFHGDNVVPHNGFAPEELCGMLENAGFTVLQHYELGAVNKPDKGGVPRRYGMFVLEARKE